MNDENLTTSSNSSENVPPPIFQEFLAEVEQDEFDLISKQMDTLIEIKNNKKDIVEDVIVFDKNYVLSKCPIVKKEDLIEKDLDKYFCLLTSISTRISQGINIEDINKYFIIDSVNNDTGRFGISNTKNAWAAGLQDLILYQINDDYIYELFKSKEIFDKIMNFNENISTDISKLKLINEKKLNSKEKLKLINPDLYQALIESFSEERFGVFFIDNKSSLSTKYNIRIHYPQINISNSKNEKHTIKDLVVTLNFQNDLLQRFGCLKSTFFYKELSSNHKLYIHSHCERMDVETLKRSVNGNTIAGNEFCLGTGTPIANIVSVLKLKKGSFDQYYGFLNSIQPYLEWESLEGVPYNKIRDNVNFITSGLKKFSKDSDVKYNHIINIINCISHKQLTSLLFKHKDLFDFYINDDGKFIIKINSSNYEDHLKIFNEIKSNFNSNNFNYLTKTFLIDNEYYIDAENTNLENQKYKDFINNFNNSKYKLQLSDEVFLPIEIIDENGKKEEIFYSIIPEFIEVLEKNIIDEINFSHIK